VVRSTLPPTVSLPPHQLHPRPDAACRDPTPARTRAAAKNLTSALPDPRRGALE